MKFIHTSDLHIGKTLFEYSLLEDQRYFLSKLIELIDKEKADALLIAGDIYDRAVPAAEAVSLLDDFLYQVIGERKIPVMVIAGNHDSPERLEFASRLMRRSGFYLAGIASAEIMKVTLKDEYGPVTFHLLPYLQPAQIRHTLQDLTIKTYQDAYSALLSRNIPDQNSRNVLLAHGFFSQLSQTGEPLQLITSDSEISIGGADLVDARLFNHYDYVALGHLHTPQKVGKQSVRYSGSPIKYSVSEASVSKAVSVIELKEKGNLTITQQPIQPLRDLRVVSGTLEDLLDSQNQQGENLDDYVFARVYTTGLVANAMERLRTLFPHILGLKLIDQSRQTELIQDVQEQLRQKDLPTLFHEFYHQVKGYDLDPKASEAVLSAAAELIEGKEELK